jgi:hypothetical protein
MPPARFLEQETIPLGTLGPACEPSCYRPVTWACSFGAQLLGPE